MKPASPQRCADFADGALARAGFRISDRFAALRPLPAALALSLAAGGGDAGAFSHDRTTFRLDGMQGLATSAVFNCADSGPGSLRAAIDSATDGATIDMTTLSCSTISLSSDLAVAVDNLTIVGPGRDKLSIKPQDFDEYFRVFRHTGAGSLTLQGILVGGGAAGRPPGGFGSGDGGCIDSAGNVVLIDSRVSSCHSYWSTADSGFHGGAGVHAQNVTLQNSVVSNNFAMTSGTRCAGGGIFAELGLYLTNSTVAGNDCNAAGSTAYGGGAAARGNVQVVASTISGNTAGDFPNQAFAGGLDILDFFGSATAVITNSTISDNYSCDRVGGVVSAAPLVVRNSTISFNLSRNLSSNGKPYAAGLLVYGGAVSLQSTIISNNLGNGNLYDFSLINASASGANNLITGSGASPAGTLTDDPLLGPLSDAGGPTQTRAPGSGSPAIRAGNNPAGLVNDQRGPGYARTFAHKTDIGAFQTGDGIFNSDLEQVGTP